MAALEPLRVGGRVLADGARLAADAVAERLGDALPDSPEQIAHTQVFAELLREYGRPGVADAAVRDVRRLGITAVSSNCTNAVLEIDAPESGLAPRVYVKLPSASLLTRWFCNVLDIWRLECSFYDRVADRLTIRVPDVYVIATKRTRFVLVLEDLSALDGVRLFTNPDMVEGPGLDTTRACLSTLAALHASMWALAPSEREALLSRSLHPFLSDRAIRLNPMLGRAAIGPCRRRAPGVIDDDLAALYMRALSRWSDLRDRWYREPLTLVHGDSHLGNFFADGEDMGMLDWQAVHWAPGIRDVQYFLIDSLPAHVLAEHEEALVTHYVAELARHGVTYEFAPAWDAYRGFSFQTLMTAVVSLGLGALSGDAVMRAVLDRSAAALKRLRFDAWLG